MRSWIVSDAAPDAPILLPPIEGPAASITTVDAVDPPPVSDTSVPAAADVPAPQHAQFTGTGREYFQIWIVNLLLTIVTLGIYSAWAKVRRLQYFYRHTRLAGAGFDRLQLASAFAGLRLPADGRPHLGLIEFRK